MTIVQDMEIVLDILDMISSMRQRWTQKGIKMRSNHGLNAPRRSPGRDDRNGHMDHLIRSPGVGVMAPESSPIWAKPVWPDLRTGLTGLGCGAARGVQSDRIW
jgi:hypothetical protein